MEIKDKKAVWLNPSHPNYCRWQKGREVKKERAAIVSKIISPDKICNGLKVLDIGSGEGGTSVYFSEFNMVVSYDLSLIRLKGQCSNSYNPALINGQGECLPFHDSSFDLIILQDVLEHIINRDLLVKEIKRVLKRSGLIYISTPNKFSVFNIISDPHWGIPMLSLFNRDRIRKYFLRFFRKEDLSRKDIAQLLSIKDIYRLFPEYKISLFTKEIANLLSEDSKGIIWSNFHLMLFRLLKKSRALLILKIFANNKLGFINNYLTPTFFLIIKNNPLIQ